MNKPLINFDIKNNYMKYMDENIKILSTYLKKLFKYVILWKISLIKK